VDGVLPRSELALQHSQEPADALVACIQAAGGRRAYLACLLVELHAVARDVVARCA
jgi:hypothetical protein